MRNLTQDGGFGPWAPWQPCNHDDGDGSVSSCLCRSRSCDGPVARCGGVQCKGSTIQVANCSRCSFSVQTHTVSTHNTEDELFCRSSSQKTGINLYYSRDYRQRPLISLINQKIVKFYTAKVLYYERGSLKGESR